MSISVVRGATDKPAASEALATAVAGQPDSSGKLFIGFPVLPGPDGPRPVDALWASPDHGLIIFDLVEGSELGAFRERQDDMANKLEGKLKPYRQLTRGRHLRIPIHTVSFAPAVSPSVTRSVGNTDYLVTTRDTFTDALQACHWNHPNEELYRATLQALENVATIRRNLQRQDCSNPESRGATLHKLEKSISTLDPEQSQAYIETVDGIQRIRGLAGSGKTIVLALKAAYLHVSRPSWRIAVTFHTRSLKSFLRDKIKQFCIGQQTESPDWSRLKVINSWGARGGGDSAGMYRDFCTVHGVQPYGFTAAKNRFGRKRAFAAACDEALAGHRSSHPQYDAILIDEAQDLPPSFLRLCYAFLGPRKHLVYAYDELQNLWQDSLPSPPDLFGDDAKWDPHSESHDIILGRCYRNSRPVLSTAHAVGFGVYREAPKPGDHGLVQMFDDARLWQEVGYKLNAGLLRGGHRVELQRTEDTSPLFLEKHSAVEDLVAFKCFGHHHAQAHWVAEEIKRNLTVDELQAEDIMVISPDATSPATGKLQPIIDRLSALHINCHVPGEDTDRDTFFRSGSVTLSGVNRAKGNEAGMVYVVNADEGLGVRHNLATTRNCLFTAITRSKAWVRVCGIGPSMEALAGEFAELVQRDYQLHFVYPTDAQLKTMRVVHRDMSAAEGKRLKGHRDNLARLLQDLDAGHLYMEDLEDIGEDVIERLRTLVGRRRTGGDT